MHTLAAKNGADRGELIAPEICSVLGLSHSDLEGEAGLRALPPVTAAQRLADRAAVTPVLPRTEELPL